MNKLLTNGITSAMMALGLCSAPVQAYSTNANRSYMRASDIDDALIRQAAGHQPVLALSKQLKSNVEPLSHSLMHLSPSKATGVELKVNSSQIALLENSVPEALNLEIKKKQLVTELIIIDQAVPDKHAFYKDLKPGVDIVEISSDRDGLLQLKSILSRYRNLDSLHIVSHAEDGELLLGEGKITETSLRQDLTAFAAIDEAMNTDADILFYGCNLAKSKKGESFLEVIAEKANVDVAASSNFTGSSSKNGDWELEIATGNIDSKVPFTPAALDSFSEVLGSYSPREFCNDSNGGKYRTNITSITSEDGNYTVTSSPASFNCGYNGTLGYRAGNHTIYIATNGDDFELSALRLGGGCSTVSAYGYNNNVYVDSSLNNTTVSSNNNVNMTNFSGKMLDKLLVYVSGCSGQMGISSFTTVVPEPEINIKGNGQTISDGDLTPSTSDHTDFGAHIVGGANLVRTFTIENTGTASLDLTDATNVAITGSADFTVNAQPASDPVSASGSTTFQVTLDPTTAGTQNATISIANNDADENPYNFSITASNILLNSDGNLTSAAGVSEPVNLPWSVDTVGEAVDLFDFTLSDGGSGDGLAMTASNIVVNVTGTANDTDRAKVTWRLNGNDAANVVGTYNAGSDTVTFSGLSISIADGTSEVYTVNGYYNDNSSLTHGNTIILSLDGGTDVTIGGSGTQMGATSAVNNGTGIVVADNIAPLVTSVNVPTNATYTAAANLDFTVNFNENVTVNTGGGTPRLALTIGATGRFADYISGSGTSALIFRESVVAGDQDLDGIALGATVDPNSGTLQDSAGNNINTTLNSVGSLASVLVDALAPTLAEVTAVTTPGNDTTPDVTFSTNEAGTLAVGGSCGSASEGAIGSGNSTITLTQPDNSTPLTAGTYNDCTVIVTDSVGNVSNVPTLSSFVIDLTAPTVAEVTPVSTPGNDSTPDVTFSTDEGGTLSIGGSCGSASEGVIGSGNSTITLTQTDNSTALTAGTYSDCTVIVTDSAGNANTSMTLSSFTVDLAGPTLSESTPVVTPNNDTTPDVTFSTTEAGTLAVGGSCGSASEGAIGSGSNTVTLTQTDNSSALAAGTYADCTLTVTDSVGNASSALTLTSFTIDTTGPTVAEVAQVVTPGNDSTPNVTFSTTEAGILAVGGSCGSGEEGAISSGNNTISLTQADNSTALADGAYSDCTITVTDSAGNANSPVTLSSFTIDVAASTVSSVAVPGSGTYIAGQNLDFMVNFDENISVNTAGGTPQLSMIVGATTRQASYISGSGTTALLFRYTVQSGDNDTDGIAVGTLSANGGTVRDSASNDATLTLNSVGSTASVLVDAVAPTVSSVNVPANATYIAAQNLDFTVNFSESMTVNTTGGTPQLSLTIGATTRQATYVSGSGTMALLFRYTVQTGDNDTDGIAVGTLSANGGTVRDSATNDATLTLNSVGSTTSVLVDAVASTVSSVNVPANATYIAAQNLDFTVNFSESMTVNTAGGTPQLSLTIGATTRQANYVSGSGTTALLFRYTVQTGDNDTDGVAVGTLSANGGTLRDSASNDATLTLNSVGSTNSVLVDALASTISSVSIPNTAHKVGDIVTATITVSADVDDYTTGSGGISGTIAGYVLGSLSKTTDTTYTATFTITDGGIDVAAGSNIPVNFTLTDSVGNTGSAYTTAISQASDAVFANLPDVDLTASTNTIAEDGGSSTLTATLSGSLSNQWPVDITVNLAYSGTATIATDYTKSDSITISSGSSTGTSTVTAVADTLYDAAIAETVIVDISSVSVGSEGSTNQQTISITDAESAPTVSLSVGSNTILETGGTSTVTASLSNPTYENVTVNLGYSGTAINGTDYGVPSASIMIVAGSTSANAVTGVNSIDDANSEDSETIIIEISSVTGGGATENAVQQQTITLTDDDNVAPVITSTAITTIDEDALYSYTFTVTDANAGDTLTLSAPTLPAWLSFAANTGVLSGTPDNDDIGPHVVKLRVNDGTIDVDQDFMITVANTNDAPTLTGTPITSAVEGVAYNFTVIGADVDVGASLNYVLSNQPAWLSVNSSGLVSGTPTNSDVGTATNIVISVSDGTETTSLPAFNIVVDADMDGDGIGNAVDTDIDGDGMSNDFETANGLDPLDPSDATGDLDGDGISNLDEFINNTDPTADDYGPIISLDSNVVIDAVALLTDLPDGLASAVDALDGEVVVTHDLTSELLKPGRYTINWSAEDAAGNVTIETQTLDVRPIANWQVDQETSEGNIVTVSLYLNGEAPEYPVVADYTVLGTATNPEDHDAVSGSLTITEGRRGSITLNTVSDASIETDETIIFELDSITNAVAGVKQEHIVTIGELNHPPAVALSAALDSAPAKKLNVFSTTDGMVTITATVSDVDTGDAHTFEWLGGNMLNGTVTGNTYSFNPATAGKGVYQLTVKASDDASNPKSGSAVITLTVLSESLVLSNTTDRDSDGIDDLSEGFGDSDGDNVPDFADDIEAPNLLAMYPIGGAITDGAWFVETQDGLSLKLNLYSSGSEKYSPLLNAQQLVDENDRDRSDGGYIYDGGIFDFVVSNMPVPGQRVLVVIPQLQAIPENPVYRKLIDNTWSEYVVDANNTLQSAPGKLGVCPPPGSAEYTDGLTEGYFCVQLGIEDGGMNDADGEADGTILDPGGVGQGIPVSIRSSGGAMSWPLLLLLSCLTLVFRSRQTNHLRKGE